MPRRTPVVQAPRNPDNEAVKPEPDEGMWEKLEELALSVGYCKPMPQPPGTFTMSQYARRRGIALSTAKSQISRLKIRGKIAPVGNGKNNAHFYRIV